MENFIPFRSRNVSAKITEAEHAVVVEKMKQFYGENLEQITFRQFFVDLLNSNSAPADPNIAAQVSELEHKLFKSESENTLLAENAEVLQRNLAAVTAELNEIKERQNQRGEIIPANAVIVEVEPIIDHFLTIMAEAATRKMKKEITRADILKNNFWDQVKDGPGDHLPLVITRAQVVREIQKLKEKEG